MSGHSRSFSDPAPAKGSGHSSAANPKAGLVGHIPLSSWARAERPGSLSSGGHVHWMDSARYADRSDHVILSKAGTHSEEFRQHHVFFFGWLLRKDNTKKICACDGAANRSNDERS